MHLITPFRALRPVSSRATAVVPPADEVWNGADLTRLLRSAALLRDPAPAYYAYRLEAGGHQQTGLAGAASLQAYREQRIKRHEWTRPDQETDRARRIQALGAQTGPVMLVYPEAPEVDRLLDEATMGAPETMLSTKDGVRHSIWPITHAALIDRLRQAFDELPALYIADGHHRTAAADRGASSRFLAVAFPHHSMRIAEYNRVVTDLGGLSDDGFLERVGERFGVTAASGPLRPSARGEFALHLPGRWFSLRADPALSALTDPVARLDVSILSSQLLGPILAIEDLRRDPRIEFVGGNRGLDELERRVASRRSAAAFVLHPTTIVDLMEIADRGSLMPPKSTWFEPKLADGLVSYVLDGEPA